MTRRQVAHRLGKSIAAVRRLEGVLLHPATDARGVHRFDADEVEALAQRIQQGEVTLWEELRPSSGQMGSSVFEADRRAVDDCQACQHLEVQVARLRRELQEQERSHQREAEATRAELERERSRYETERRQLDRELREFIAMVETA